MLGGKKIIVGVTGSIAAYKAAILVRELIREGAEVRVLMTPLAKQFITPLTLATLSRHPILVEFFDPESGQWNSHVSLGEWADCPPSRSPCGLFCCPPCGLPRRPSRRPAGFSTPFSDTFSAGFSAGFPVIFSFGISLRCFVRMR